MPVFHNVDGKLKKLALLPLDKERALQKLIQDNLLEVLDMHFLSSEYQTTHGGRIDTIAIDSNGAPVIIEYKRNKNDNVITQSLFYLNWLKSQKVEFFEMLVTKKLGHEKADKIDWKNPRVICIAESYNPYDIFALNEISAKLELYRYHYYENNTFTLENVKGDEEKPKFAEQAVSDRPVEYSPTKNNEISLEIHLNKGQPFVQELFLILKGKIFELDENIEEKINNNYIAFKVSKIFAEVHVQKSKLLLYLRPINYNDPETRLYKVPDSYNWVLDRRVYINNEDDIDYVMKLIEQSYQDIL
jgi:predicted transport protein